MFTPDPAIRAGRLSLSERFWKIPCDLVEQSAILVGVVVSVNDDLPGRIVPQSLIAKGGEYCRLGAPGMAVDENSSIHFSDTEGWVVIVMCRAPGHQARSDTLSFETADKRF